MSGNLSRLGDREADLADRGDLEREGERDIDLDLDAERDLDADADLPRRPDLDLGTALPLYKSMSFLYLRCMRLWRRLNKARLELPNSLYHHLTELLYPRAHRFTSLSGPFAPLYISDGQRRG